MKICVTGGAGFIGSNLVDALLGKGFRVTVLDNFSTGKRKNLEQCAGNPLFELIEGDIRDFEMCKRAVEGCDYVFHEAALGSVPRSIANPQASLEVNVQGFCNMIEAARLAGVKRFIYASSSSVYGDDPHLPKVETFTGNALSPYALSKQMDEKIAENYNRVYGFETIGLRYFNVFGRRQDPEGAYAAVIPKFIMAVLRRERPVINGDGSVSRDFTYIDNVIQANLRCMETEFSNTVYNIACGDRTTLNQLFEYISEGTGIEAVYGPVRKGDIPHSLADISKAAKELQYVPEVDIRTGLQLTREWYQKNL
ncbi:MAG: SDR family oxidoreductase [Lentisphaeria bacterium]|nr:SDR family oxidoreductase [Lentisphaeria bacterium]